jgi:hypothetical protein
MASNICSSNITSGFIDLATYDELEKYMYGCGDAVAYFVRTTCKSTWFTQVPVVLSNASGQPKFGQNWSVSISRAGDYLLQTWLRVGLKQVQAASGVRLRWTRNLMHNLIKECCITFNDLVAARFDNIHLDFWSAFTVPRGKQVAYNNMIGNTVALTNTSGIAGFLPPQLDNLAGAPVNAQQQPKITYLNLPLPFFYSRDSGVALPTAALPYNEMRINFTFRNWNELLIKELNVTAGTANAAYVSQPSASDLQGNVEPSFDSVQVWANYAIVSNDERKRMACAPRDILIEQAQMANYVTVNPGSAAVVNIDLRLSHAIKVLFFALQNWTNGSRSVGEWSTYTTGPPQMGDLTACPVKFSGQFQIDPLDRVSLIYENTNRLGEMGADFYSTQGNATTPPFNQAAAVGPNNPQSSGLQEQQKYRFVLTCVNNNIIRISGGALGFPVL